MRRPRAMVAAFLLLALLAPACAKKTKTSGTTPAQIPVYTITASEPSAGRYAFDVPIGMKGGVITLRLVNNGKEDHDFQLARPAPGHTLDDIVASLSSEDAALPEWIRAAGGIGGVDPGATGEVTLQLAPGTYWYFCTESNDEGEESVHHAQNGMAGELTLSGESGAKIPTTAGSITAREYQFTTSGLVAGSNRITFRNDGQQLHHAIFAPLLPGKTLEDAKKAILSEEEPSGPPPIDFDKAATSAVIDPGQSVVVTFELQAGTNYLLACFLPDKGTAGPPHAAKGMIAEEKIA